MKSIRTKISCCFFSLLIALLTFATPVSAIEPIENTVSTKPVSISSVNETRRADEIVWKYTTIDGRLHKRRYNATRDEWVDSDWIPC